MNTPYFSIITPTYNSLSYLKKCIKSVHCQTFQSFEHIIIDDGSSDETRNYLETKKSIKDKIIYAEHSGLPGVVRNIGLNNAIGQYICFLDADDFFNQEKLEILFHILQKNKFDLIYHDEVAMKKSQRYKLEYPNARFITKNNLVRFGNRLSTSTITISKKFLIDYNLRFSESAEHRIVEDYHLWVRILNFNPRIKKLNKILGIYSIHNDGISRNIDQLLINERNSILDLHKKNFINKGQLLFALKRIELNFLMHSQRNIKHLIFSYFNLKNFIPFNIFLFYRLFEKFKKFIRNY